MLNCLNRSLRLKIGNISDDKQPGSEFQLLNIHLVHGEGDETWKDRDASLKKVQDGNNLSAKGVSLYGPAPPDDSGREAWLDVDLHDNELIKIADTKIQLDELFSVHQPKGTTIVCGDTNYRISKLNREQVLEYIRNEQYAELLAFEQLTNSKLLQNIFCGFTEGKINFGPTYKMRAVGVYDEKRLPAYTDRILFASQMDLKQNVYNCHLMDGSDHVPVYSEFTVDVDQVDEPILAQLKYKFHQYYNNVIEKMELIDIEPKVINLKTCLEMPETVTFKIHNVCEEELVYHITGGDSGLFKRTDTTLAMQMGVLAPKESKTVTMQLDPPNQSISTPLQRPSLVLVWLSYLTNNTLTSSRPLTSY
ncbi:unnamed protein product [Ambrosiozyma monospora]|uniref:Unnamed protein product n=1 Tax=Ambrosiozyma monospora TaxID=43982 RepID=A0A9W6T157_AMBMO|nr:unnamed protein product [Ambrosiozyma monospora]